ncbi:MAG: polyhydroxyalkanoic acid system family protein [Sphingobacteriales bacterium]|nr:polyhydroxyalkanoic acid system family protein [Sphingobacteriales bacterium]OJY82521.1 MAG: hypothetical protein BGP14_18000 [Sphingobacteriales bacterium 44-15]
MKVTIPHSHTKEEAVLRIKSLLTELKTKYADRIRNVQETWEGDRGNFSMSLGSFSASGIIDVHPSDVEVNIDLPFFASMFSKQISNLIEEEAKKVLS